MTPLERAKTLEAWAKHIGEQQRALTHTEVRRTIMALLGAALDLRHIHEHDMKRRNAEWELNESTILIEAYDPSKQIAKNEENND